MFLSGEKDDNSLSPVPKLPGYEENFVILSIQRPAKTTPLVIT